MERLRDISRVGEKNIKENFFLVGKRKGDFMKTFPERFKGQEREFNE